MTVDATGIISRPLKVMQRMVAASTNFMAWTALATPDEARAVAYLVTSERNPAARFVIIDFGDFTRDRVSINNAKPFQEREGSSMLLYFRGDVGAGTDEEELLTFSNAVGGVWSDLELAAGIYKDTNIAVHSIDMKVPITRTPYEDRQTAGDYFECVLEVFYKRQP